MKISVRNVTRRGARPETAVQRILKHRLLSFYAVLLSLSYALAVVTFGLFTQRTLDAANSSSGSPGPGSTARALVGDPLVGINLNLGPVQVWDGDDH